MAVGSYDEQIRPVVHCLGEHDLCDRSVIRSHPSDMHAGAMARKIQSDIGARFLAMLGTFDRIYDQYCHRCRCNEEGHRVGYSTSRCTAPVPADQDVVANRVAVPCVWHDEQGHATGEQYAFGRHFIRKTMRLGMTDHHQIGVKGAEDSLCRGFPPTDRTKLSVDVEPDAEGPKVLGQHCAEAS